MLLESVLIFFDLLAVLSYLKFRTSQEHRYGKRGVSRPGPVRVPFPAGERLTRCLGHPHGPLARDLINTSSFFCDLN